MIEAAILEEIRNGNNHLTLEDIATRFNSTTASINKTIQKLEKENKLFKLKSNEQYAYFTYEQIRDDNIIEKYIKQGNTTDFKLITTSEGLITYLRDTNRRLERRDGVDAYIYHYTNLNAVLGIIRSGFWYLNNPVNMNDGLEYYHGSKEAWRSIFFSSFMTESKESLAMWSMYAQPWDKGVMIAIPMKAFKKWVRGIDKVYEADMKTKQPILDRYMERKELELFISNVAYCNTDSIGEDGVEITTCGNASNLLLKDVANDPKLVGYVKNEAWSYEKEVRLRVNLNNDTEFKAIALPITDELIDSMIITKGPRFQGDIINELEKEIRRTYAVKKSLFYGKFRYIPCDSCRRK